MRDLGGRLERLTEVLEWAGVIETSVVRGTITPIEVAMPVLRTVSGHCPEPAE